MTINFSAYVACLLLLISLSTYAAEDGAAGGRGPAIDGQIDSDFALRRHEQGRL